MKLIVREASVKGDILLSLFTDWSISNLVKFQVDIKRKAGLYYISIMICVPTAIPSFNILLRAISNNNTATTEHIQTLLL